MNTNDSDNTTYPAITRSSIARFYLTDNEQITTKITIDDIIVEQPLALNLHYFSRQFGDYQEKALTVTMRTPGHDRELIIGWMLAENIISDVSQIQQITFSNTQKNQADVTLIESVDVNLPMLAREFASYSSCGVCGKSSINQVDLKITRKINTDEHWLNVEHITELPKLLWQQQTFFQQTGGIHAAGYFSDNKLRYCFEDVGRHNAVDKVIGKIALNNTFDAQGVLILSGRISFELVQKAAMMAIPVLVAVGAPSSLAIQAAQQFNITLIGFIKETQFNVYHAPWRIKVANKMTHYENTDESKTL
jgi:FdhD protein